MNSYSRIIKNIKIGEKVISVWIDVYDVLRAFKTKCPAMDHAIKKCLAAGTRGAKDSIQDKEEAIKSIKRSIEMEKENL